MTEELDPMRRLVMIASIPVEMFWAYQAIQRCGIWNLACFFFPGVGGDDTREIIKVMDEAYIKFCIYNNADIERPIYDHVRRGHIQLIQHFYNELMELHPEMPKGVVEIKKEITTRITF